MSSMMIEGRGTLVRRRDVIRKLISVLIHRYEKRLAREHVAANEPQVAVFSFDMIGTAINLFGRYEREELDALLRWLEENCSFGGACIDVGANVGNHALFFSRRFRKVFAFEPNPRVFSLLEINASQANGIRCFNVGLSSQNGDARFAWPTAINTGVGRVLSDDEQSQESRKVRLVRLDDISEVASETIGFIKIDVEGHELDVLQGATRTIARDRPIIVFEQSSLVFSNGTSACVEFLRKLGYRRFLTVEKFPQFGNVYLNAVARLVCGERIAFVGIERFKTATYSMIIAVQT